MPYQVTVAPGLSNVVLPDGLRHKAGDVVTLTDDQYGTLSATALSSLLSTVSQQAGGGTAQGFLAPSVVPVTDGSSVTLNASLGNDFRWTLGGSSHTLTISHPANGQLITVAVNYSGSFTPLFSAVFDFGAGGQPTWSAASGKTDYAGFRYDSALNAGTGAWAYQGSILGLTS